MQRDLATMAASEHDLLIIGGGVTGACAARDAAMRGLSVALVDKLDFCHATSAASSKLIHGGLRYLKNFEISLVRESLKERRYWEVIAPHLVHPLPTLLPVYKRKGSPRMLTLRVGLTLYDLLAFDRNRLEDEDKKLPGHRNLSRAEALEYEPSLPTTDLDGGILYYDCQMYAPERLCFENVIDAVDRGAQVANYAAVTEFLVEDANVRGVVVRDELDGSTHQVRAKVTLNASGPWADRLLARLPGTGSSTKITRSKGIHIITRPITGDHALAIEHQGGHFFLLPWRNHTLIGTTDSVFTEEPDAFAVKESDITDLIATVNAGYPSAALTRDDVVHFYGGLRPLVESGGDETYEASRRAEVYDHAQTDGVGHLISALGGKWTTSRHLAEQVMEMVAEKLGHALPSCATHVVPLPGGHTDKFSAYQAAAREQHADRPVEIVDELVRNYGTRYEEILGLADDDPSLGEPLAPGHPEIGAQVVHAVRHEMAMCLEDVVMRRTGLGTLGFPGADALQRVARLMGDELGWDAAARDAQIEAVRGRFTPAAG
jgi:glycerol-3-phosphate dehydrogenase